MTAPPPLPDTTALVVNERIVIPRSELVFRASRAGGPGGQHVNTSSTRVELMWDFAHSAAIDTEIRATLLEKLAARLDSEGQLRVVASAERSQLQNREAAEAKLAELIRHALVVRKPRRKTRVPRGAVEDRLKEKKLRASRKKDRRKDSFD
ncbi:MAG TPA: alternative ribosome rescue aminoacyl-tRNA hydrolase ArfB [Gemmatimonadaceae bacterium]|nr:alternative ribosome rescue aminoacyl-tRNA hydrolase ArfB [Gemmatimonadaceae bacterium]